MNDKWEFYKDNSGEWRWRKQVMVELLGRQVKVMLISQIA